MANWFPNNKIALGDIGVFDGYQFNRISSLEKLGIPFEERQGEKPIDLSYVKQAEINFAAGGEMAPPDGMVSGNVKMQFQRAGAFSFDVANCFVHEIEDKLSLGNKIKQLYKDGQWEEDWVVIDSLVAAGVTTILVAESNNAELELQAKENLGELKLTNANARLSVKSQKGEITSLLGKEGLTPLFKTSKVKRSFLAGLTRRKDNVRYGGQVVDRPEMTTGEDDMWEQTQMETDN